MTDLELGRRDLLKLIGSVAVAADLLYAQPTEYQPRFLIPAEYEFTAELCEIIIPTDAESPGAKQAGVPWFIDTVLLYADVHRQQDWRSGLAGIDALAQRMRGNKFLRCSVADRLEVVQHLSEREDDAGSPEGKFLGELKAIAIEAFCLSDLGMSKYLHYRGNVVLSEFPGCTSEPAILS
jgi:hypothetical protein